MVGGMGVVVFKVAPSILLHMAVVTPSFMLHEDFGDGLAECVSIGLSWLSAQLGYVDARSCE